MSRYSSVFLLLLSPLSLALSLTGREDHGSAPNSVLEDYADLTNEVEEDMATGELDVNHYPARRAAQVALHHLNTLHGSPFTLLRLHRLLKARAEDVGDGGRKYHLDFSVKEVISNNTVGPCSVELLFPRGGGQEEPRVSSSTCDGLQNTNSSAEEEEFYQRHRASASPVSGQDIPDSFGNMAPGMRPFWHLGHVVASWVMLKLSNESTLYNMAQVGNFTQLDTQDDQLRFQYHILLHEMVSQEIIHWKVLASWSPVGGVKMLKAEWLPKCEHGYKPDVVTVTVLPASTN